jgi:hypothetical protein
MLRYLVICLGVVAIVVVGVFAGTTTDRPTQMERTVYRDEDEDGVGTIFSTAKIRVDQKVPPGYVEYEGDCNDHNARVHPFMGMVRGIDDANCDGVPDRDEPDNLWRLTELKETPMPVKPSPYDWLGPPPR